MNKKILSAICCAMVLNASAQETYQSATVTDRALNGTARYVGMGGAMEALGGDLSVMSSNPAGIGLMRRSQAAVSFGLQSLSGMSALDGSKTTPSFDQAGIVFSMKTGIDSNVNFGFNYHKSKNFNSLLNVSDALTMASQNKLSAIKYYDGILSEGNYSQIDYLYNVVLDGIVDGEGEVLKDFYQYFNANGYHTQRVESGYTADYDLNISGNIHNSFYWGLTLGIQDMRYNSSTLYTENLLAADDVTPLGTVETEDTRVINGSGFNLKLGFIIRPIPTSGFRLGGYIHTPTWYKLFTDNYTVMRNYLPQDFGNFDTWRSNESMDYYINTPWKFGVSLGHTVGTFLALGATYEYADYSSISNRKMKGSYYGNGSVSDRLMNEHTKATLKGVHNIKFGVEAKVMPQLALRAGFNYQTPKYNAGAFRDVTIDSPGTYMSSTTDYINWKETKRITCGLGYNIGDINIDLAYQYCTTDGDYHPFVSYECDDVADPLNNISRGINVSDNRHQLLLTLGYKF